MMTLDEFTQACTELYMMGTITLTPTTRFRENDEFDSLIGFAMLNLIQEHLHYNMGVSEFLKCHTTEDLYKAATR